MSTATVVHTTYELEGDDALKTLRSCGWLELFKDAFIRFRAADGFSHSRALGFQVMLTALPGVIAAVALANYIGQESARQAFERFVVGLAPGPAGQIFTQALNQGSKTSSRTALIVGLIGAMAAGTTAMGQIERGANRIYGVERDRPTLYKYGLALVLALTAGILSVVSFFLLAVGPQITSAGKAAGGWSDTLTTALRLGRWPVGILLAIVAISLMFKWAPKRRQPAASWLASGAAIAVVLWVGFTGLLAFYLTASKSFGQTYGPLAGVIGMMIWSFLTSLALFLGLAFAAQLEAVRAGVPSPRTGQDEDVPENGSRVPERASL